MARKVRTRTKNTGLEWFFTMYPPGTRELAAARKRIKAERARTKPSSTSLRRINRLRRKKKKIRLKQLGE